VWDLPTRVFHWLLVASLTASWITAEIGYDWTETHFLLGYCNLTLVLFRVVWGIVGPQHARFTSFMRGPSSALSAVPALFSRKPGTHVGHNPIGAWSVAIFLVLVAIQAGTGLFISDDILYAGPYNGVISSSLAGTLANIHHLNFKVLTTFVALHVIAITWYALGKRTNLLRPMLTGRKANVDPGQGINSSRTGTALVVLAVAALAVAALVLLAPAPSMDDYYY